MADAVPSRARRVHPSPPTLAQTRRALARAEAGKVLSLEETESLLVARGGDLERLMAAA